MSYQQKDVIVTPEFFQKHSAVASAIPPKEVYSIDEKGKTTTVQLPLAQLTETRCTIFRNIDRYISPNLKRVIEENHLFAFGYSYIKMGKSHHIRILVSTKPVVELMWLNEDYWGFLDVKQPPDADNYLGMALFSDSGNYQVVSYGRYPIKVDGKAYFSCSHFRLKGPDVNVCEFDLEKKQMIVMPDAQFDVSDKRGLDALAEDLAKFVNSTKPRPRIDDRKGLNIFVTPGHDVEITKEILAESDGYINFVPDKSVAASQDGASKDWPEARIIENVSPYITSDFADYLEDGDGQYMTFAIDNGCHPNMPVGIPAIIVVVIKGETARLSVGDNYRVCLKPSKEDHYGEVRLYRSPEMEGYRVVIAGKCPHYYKGILDTTEHTAKIDDPSGFDLLELAMRRGKL